MEILMLKKLLYLLVLLLVLATSHLPLATAQSTSASLTGLVEDPSKALIPGATITAINTQTGEKASTTTNKEGQYVLPGLNPGTYRIEVDKPGFKGIIEAGLTLHVQDAVQINFHMAVGSSSESVTVNAEQININTQDGTVSTVVDQSYIANMPLNGRSFQDLILLTPGVVTNSPQGSTGGGEFSVNGQRTEENYYTVDGVAANVGVPSGPSYLAAGYSGSLPGSTALGTTQGLASADSLQEFRVQSSSYSSEYGRNPGGQFAFETKSGTKQPHGSLSEYFRNGSLDSADWFNGFYGIPYPEIHQNDFGGTFGAPVFIPRLYERKDKTFFFVSYEGLRLLSPQAASINDVPDMEARTTSPQALQSVLNAFTVPNGPDLGDGIAEYIGSWSNPSAINSTSVRLDHAVTEKTRVFFRFSETNSSSEGRPSGESNGLNPSDPGTTSYILRTYTLGENNALTTRLANELRVNHSSNNGNTIVNPDGFGGAVPVNMLQAAGLPPLNQGSLADFLYFVNPNYNIGTESGSTPSSQAQWNIVDSVSLDAGHHGLKFGIDYRRLTPSVHSYTGGGAWLYLSESQLDTNTPLSESIANTPYYGLYTNFAAFAQDEWRATNKLNLSFGIRWDINPPPGVTQGIMPYTLTNLDNPNSATLAPYGTPLWRTTWFNFAPRFGAAYRIQTNPGHETVVRAGGGLFFDTGQQLGSAGVYVGPGTNATSGFANGSYPQLPPIPQVVNPPIPPYNNVNIFAFDPHLQLPYTLQWNLSLQQAIGANQSLTLSYVGSHAARLLKTNQINPPNNPDLGGYQLIGNGNTSDYNSLQTQFQRRLSAGLTVLASYTWSHCLDYGSANADFGYLRGNCGYDVRNNFATAISYSVPFLGDSHWGLDNRLTARTAFPVSLAGNGLLQTNFQLYDAGVNLVPGQPIYLFGADCTSTFLAINGLQPGQSCPGGRGINPNAFVQVNSGNGDAPRNFVRGFDSFQLDTAVRREFPIHETLTLQFRAEAFNILNHANFGSINGGLGSNNFGLATATLANSLGTLSSLYQMGGARSMQLALKLIF
jgi:hypothetical protein